MNRCKLELTEEEKELYSQENTAVYETLLKCCHNGYYVSKKDGTVNYHCYPIEYRNCGVQKAFVCIPQKEEIYESAKMVLFKETGAPADYSLEINNALLPEKIEDYGEKTVIHKIIQPQYGEWLYCDIDGRKLAAPTIESYWGGGYSDGSEKAIQEIFTVVDKKGKIEEESRVVDISNCDFMDSIYWIKKRALITINDTPADPRYKNCSVIYGEISERFPKGYKCVVGNERVSLTNKSNVTKELLEIGRGEHFVGFGTKIKTKNENFRLYDLKVAYTTLERGKIYKEEKKMKENEVKVIDIAKLGASIGMEVKEQTLPNGKVVKALVWDQENLLKAVKEVKYLSEEGKPVRITGAAPAWLVSALTHTVHPCPVGLYMPQIGKDVEIPQLAHGEANPDGEVAFKVTQKGDSILIEYNMDLPEGITTYDENNLSKVVVPEVEQGKAIYISGRGPNYLTVAIAEAYAHTNSSVSLFQPGVGYTCSITHSRAKRLGDLTKDPLVKEEVKEQLAVSKEEKEGVEID